MVQRDSFTAEYGAVRYDRPLPTSSKIIRFQPFFEHNLIRLGCRLQFADLSHTEKHPILLDGSHHVTHLISHTHIQLHHLGVRILDSRSTTEHQKGLTRLLTMQNTDQCSGTRSRGTLTLGTRATFHPFAVTGLDFAGPLYTKKDTSAKSYILLLTCAKTRALHLELSCDMSVDNFVMALDRFVSRRGHPHTAYSVNATTFQAAPRELAEICSILNDPQTSHYFAHRGIT